MRILRSSPSYPIPESQEGCKHNIGLYGADKGLTWQLQPPVPGLYKSHLHTQPVFKKRRKKKKEKKKVLWSCYYSSAHRKQCRLHSVSIIYSCLDSPTTNLTAFHQLLCTHDHKTASVLRNLQARHRKNNKRHMQFICRAKPSP